MPFWGRRTRFRAGKPIVARDLNRVAEMAEKAALIQAEPPLAIVSTASGPLLRLAGMIFSVYIVVTTSTITARVGSTPGSGTAKIQTFNGTALADLGGPISKTIYNWNSAAGGVSSGKYGVVLKICGYYWLLVAEC